MANSNSRIPLILAWLPPFLVVAIAMFVTKDLPRGGGPLPAHASRIIATAMLGGGILCLLGVALGLRAAFFKSGDRKVAASLKYLVVLPAGLAMIVIWRAFFSNI